MAEELVKTTLRIQASLFKAAKIRAVERGVTLQTVVEEALRAYLKGRR